MADAKQKKYVENLGFIGISLLFNGKQPCGFLDLALMQAKFAGEPMDFADFNQMALSVDVLKLSMRGAGKAIFKAGSK